MGKDIGVHEEDMTRVEAEFNSCTVNNQPCLLKLSTETESAQVLLRVVVVPVYVGLDVGRDRERGPRDRRLTLEEAEGGRCIFG